MSIPFTSGNSFLHQGMVNFSNKDVVCQSPSRRGTHFYPYQCLGWCPWSVECQSPSRRGTHFYGSDPPRPYSRCIVSIPFTSGNSFLRSECGWLDEVRDNFVSIPFTSGNSFLPIEKQASNVKMQNKCQSPSRRGTHFYVAYEYFS